MFFTNLMVSYQDYWKETLEDGSKVKHYDYPDIWTSFAKSALRSVFLYAAIALAVVLLAVGLFVYFKKRENFKRFVTIAVSLAVGFAVTVIVAMLSLEFMDMAEDGAVFDMVLYPTVVLGACVLLGGAAWYICSLCGEKAYKIGRIVIACVVGAALVALLVCLGVYLASGAGEENNSLEITITENALLYVCAAVLVGALLFFAFFFGRKDKKGFDSKAISYAAICIAMSFALSYLKIFSLPQSGSVTIASLLPLMIYSYMFGVKKGVLTGFVYGLLQAVQNPWIIHPAQFLLDYPIAFAFIGVAGLFAHVKKLEKLPQVQFALGAVVASVLRYLSHVFSGVFAFSEYAYHWTTGEAMNPWLYSLGYNSFVLVDVIIVLIVGTLIFSSPSFVKQARKYNAQEKPLAEPTEENQ